MAYRDHIAITCGNKSTTRCEVSVGDAPLLLGSTLLSVILAIHIVALGRIRKYCPASELKTCNPLDTDGNLSRSNRDITTHLPFFTTIMRQTSRVNAPQVDTSVGDALREHSVTTDRRSHQGRKPGTVIPVRKLVGAEFPEGDLRRFCVCHRPAT